MRERPEIANLLPHLAELRRNASRARLLATQANTRLEIDNLSTYANNLDREADAVEVRLAILRATIRASDASQEIAAIESP